MKYKNITDMHTHTDNSFDANHSPMYMCETALNKGLRAIAFTDHCEADRFYKMNYGKNIRQAFFEVAKAKSAMRGRLLVLNGIEIGQGGFEPSVSDGIIALQRFDVVLGSVHNLRDGTDFYVIEDFSDFDSDKLLNEYFDEVLKMAEWGNFDVLAHLTFPFRYYYARNRILPDINDYKEKTDEILKLCAEKDIALEVNTAGLRQAINRTSPEPETVKRFKELGGKFVTVGSDAHYAKDIGVGVNKALDIIVEAGFNSTVLFQNRTPVEVPIEFD